ncbi:MAG: hypothetical protein JO300_02210 [Silvibacterium sp.]|nr:hypothetical protein [Silvibacterium sp.]MBV8437791.1 hypothetical protein [Silvibacterium sp.]
MPFSLMIKEQDHGGFLLEGGHESETPTSGGTIFTSTDATATIIVFHPPPPGKTWSMRFEPGDNITVTPVGHLLIHTQKDPSVLRCDPNEWVEGPPQYIQYTPGGAQSSGGSQGSGGSKW